MNTKAIKTNTPLEVEKKEQERTTRKKKQVLEFMREKSANVKAACRRADITRTQYYEWRKVDPDFRHETNIILDAELNYVEDQLRDLIDEHNAYAISFYLKSRHPHYKPKLKVESHTPAQSYEDAIKEEENGNQPTPANYRDAEYTQTKDTPRQ